jgi:hypothetical protein
VPNPKAAALAAIAAQLLGVKPAPARAAAAAALASGIFPAAALEPAKKPPGFFAKLFGKR